MTRAVVVCAPEQGVSPLIQAALDSGEFDCDECTAQVHVHVLIPLIGLVDVMSQHERTCPRMPPEMKVRVAGACGLN